MTYNVDDNIICIKYPFYYICDNINDYIMQYKINDAIDQE